VDANTRDAAQAQEPVNDCFSSEDLILSEDPSPRTADAKAVGNVDNRGRRRSRGRKDIPAHVGVKNNELPRTGQKQEPEVDGDPGISRDINDEQANTDNLPVPIDVGNATLPASYEQAKQALATCSSIVECKDCEDKAAALAAYGRMAGDTELEKHALRIRAHAARRAGELLRAIPAETGGRPRRKKNAGGRSPEFSDASLESAAKPMSPRAAAARDAGMSEHQVKEVTRVAAVPEDDFERQVNGSTPPSVAMLAKQGTSKRSLPTAPAAGARSAKADDHKNPSIGAEAVACALEKWQADFPPAQQKQIKVNTPERRAFVNAIKRLPPTDAAWACQLASYVQQQTRDIDEAIGCSATTS
jgi:hypothetical protein